MAQWEKYGLVTHRWFTLRTETAAYSDLPRAARFRLALEEAGGLFPVFGRFLAGRADLLPSVYLHELRNIQLPEAIPSPAALGDDLAKRLSGVVPLRCTPGADIFEAVYERRLVVIEIY